MTVDWQLQDVLNFATRAHAEVKNPDGSIGQKRKYTGEPYILHPMSVAGIVATTPFATKVMIAAALLHDVVEDTAYTLKDIAERFGEEVARLVNWLTDHSTPADGNRAKRKLAERERLARAPREAQTIKLADLISNTMSIVSLDPRFATVYLKEKRALLDIMTKGDENLYAQAVKLCEDGIRTLEEERLNNALQRPRP